MECACSIDTGGDGYGEILSETTPTARKQHKCCECGRMIEPGEKYLRETGVWDSGLQTFKTCLDCKSVRDTYFCCFEYTEVWNRMLEHISESKGEILDGLIRQLTPRAREEVFNAIEECWAELNEEEDAA